MSSSWTISIRPPFADDCWAILRARFVDAQYWEADSKQDAIDRLKAGIGEPRDVPGENPPVTRQTVAIDAHEDFANSITLDTLFEDQVGLGSFGQATTEKPWHESQPEREHIEPLYDSEAVLHATDGNGPTGHPSGWSWDYAIWAAHDTENVFDVVLHRPERYEWTTTTMETSELLRILQGRWHTQGSAHLKQFYFEQSTEDADDPYLAWEPGGIDIVPRTETPFDGGWDFCPGVPMKLNGWKYDPHASLSREVWRSEIGPERRVELHHTYGEYSFLKVYDSRVSGADAAMIPDGFDTKVQSTTSASDLRDKAVRWMRQHSPGGVAHPAFDDRLMETPNGWGLDQSPGVRYGSEFHIRYRNAATEQDADTLIEVAGVPKGTNYTVRLMQREDGVITTTDDSRIDVQENYSAMNGRRPATPTCF
ncbi:hypothetical protein EXE41_11160 [Halorubrum sp. SD690R]|uniref:hypothetical protein n=1 Tax=Halorubrum sp. SD690R TaxID=2518117 RepID=UPI0010F67A49|nr:hypothetical protein [Halorubrum sp. SD690R]TKX45572.1 hypothetical protein EXE41_11160 [Halorubrum sp. SD690R]